MTHGREEERRHAGLALWFALLGGAAAWMVHLTGSYFAAELLCVQSAADGSSTFGLAVGAASVVTGAVALATVVLGLRERTRLRRSSSHLRRIARLGYVGAALGALFVLLIALESIPLLVLGCGGF